jgi:hypothetical protein
MNTPIDIALTVAVMLGLWWLYFVGYPQLVLANTRQRLFFLRDDLFEYAAAGRIAFDAPAYVLFRTTLNGMIQYAHTLSVPRWWLLRVAMRRFGPAPEALRFGHDLEAALRELPPATRDHLRQIERTMHVTMVKHVIYRSPLLTLAFLLTRTLRHGKRAALEAWVGRRRQRQALYVFDSQAQDIGSGRSGMLCA